MKEEARITKQLILEGKEIEGVFRRAVGEALAAHKRAGNPVASWAGGRVVLVPAREIKVEEDGRR